MAFFNLFNYFIVIADIFFFKSIAWNLLSRIPYSVSVIPFPFPDSGCRVLVLPIKIHIFVKNWYRWETTLSLYMYLLFVQQCKLQYVKFHVVANSSSFSPSKSSIATVVVHTLNREIRSLVSSGCLQDRGLKRRGLTAGHGSQVRSQVTGHRSGRRSHTKTLGYWTNLFWTDVLLYKNKVSQETLMIFLSFKQYEIPHTE